MLDQYQTHDYVVEVVNQDSEQGGLVYRVQNKITSVYEYEDYLFPRLLDTMVEMQVRLDEAKLKFVPGADDSAFPVLNS